MLKCLTKMNISIRVGGHVFVDLSRLVIVSLCKPSHFGIIEEYYLECLTKMGTYVRIVGYVFEVFVDRYW